MRNSLLSWRILSYTPFLSSCLIVCPVQLSREVICYFSLSKTLHSDSALKTLCASNEEIARRGVTGNARDSKRENFRSSWDFIRWERRQSYPKSWNRNGIRDLNDHEQQEPQDEWENEDENNLWCFFNLTRKGKLSTVRHGRGKDGVTLCNRCDAVDWMQGETQAVEDESGWQFLENWLRSKKVAAQVPVVGRDSKSWSLMWHLSGKMTSEIMRWGVFIVNVTGLSRAKGHVTNGSPQDPWKSHSETEARLHRWSVKPATSASSGVDNMRWDKTRMPVRSCRWKHTSRWRSKREMKTGEVGHEEGSDSMKVLRDVTDPSRQERELHGVFWADWRKNYVRGRRRKSLHWRSRRGRIEITVPAMCLNYCFQKGRTRSAAGFHDSVIKTMVMTDHRSGAKLATNVKTKDIGDEKICSYFEVIARAGWWQSCHEIRWREKCVLNIVGAVPTMRGNRGKDTILEQSWWGRAK